MTQQAVPEDVVLSEDTSGETPIAAMEETPSAPQESEAPIASPPAETAPEDAAAFELPAELLTVAQAPNAAGIADMERQELLRLRQGQAEMNEFRRQQEHNIDIQQRQREYESRNIDPEMAQYIAEEVRAERLRGEQQLVNERVQGQIEEGKRNAALHFGKQYGVAPSALVGFGNPQDMERYAQLLSYTGKIDKRVERVEQARVPEQHFDGGQGATGGPMSGEALEEAVGNGTVQLTPETMRQLQDYHKSQGHGG